MLFNYRKYSLGGAYRKISMLPSNMSWKISQYDDATLPLVASDIELIEKKEILQCKGEILHLSDGGSCYYTFDVQMGN